MYFLCKNEKEFGEKKELVIRNIVNENSEEIESDLRLIKLKQGDPLAVMRLLSSEYEAKASLGWLNERNSKEFRKECYISGKLSLIGRYKSNWARMGSNINNFFVKLMSDNKNIIDYLTRNLDIICHEPKLDYHKGASSILFLNKTTLLALKGDWEYLKRRSEIFLKDVPKNVKKQIPDYEFFIGLAEGNVEKMKEALEKLLIPKNAKIAANDTEPYFDFYLQVQVIMYGKIASIHGYDLEIDHELAPKELIKYKPLLEEEYQDPYDFMKEFDYSAPQSEWIKKYTTD